MTTPIVAMLILDRESLLKEDDLVDEMRRCHPHFEGQIFVEQSEQGSVFIVRIGAFLATILSIHAPTPQGTLQNAIRKNSDWQLAEARLANHRAHLIVANISAANDVNQKVELAMVVTWNCAALTRLTACLWVYSGHN